METRTPGERAAHRLAAPALTGLLIALVLMLVTAPSARAQLPSLPLPDTGGGLGTVSDALCPVTQSLGDAGLEPVTGPIAQLVCSLGSLEYEFFTVYETPGGDRIERTHSATVGATANLDVDDSSGADLTGAIEIAGDLESAVLQIDRTNSSGSLPVSVEAVITEPESGDRVAFGYDQLGDTAPDGFETEIGLAGLLGGGEFDLDISQTGNVGDDTTLIASLFGGEADSRSDALSAAIAYDLSPRSAGIRLVNGDPLEIELTTDSPGPVLASLTDSGAQPFTAEAAIDDLPSSFGLTIGLEQPRVVYTGSAPIDSLGLSVVADQPLFGEARHINAGIQTLTSGTEFGVDPSGEQVSLSATDPIGEVSVYAGADPLGPGDIPSGQGIKLTDSSSEPFALGARISGLESITAGLGQAFGLSARSAGGPFGLRLALDDLVAEGEIQDLPTVVDLTVDTLSGAIDYDANTIVDRLTLSLDGLELLEGADSLATEIHGLPTRVDLALPDSGPLATLSSNMAIDQLRLAASPGTAVLPARSVLAGDPNLNDLFSFSDSGAPSAALRLSAIKGASISLDPVEISLDQNASQTKPIDLAATLGDVQVDGLLDRPGASTSLAVELDPGQPTRLVFDNSGNIGTFQLEATGLGGIDSVDATFSNLAPRMAICMDPGPACQRSNPNPISGGSSQNGRPYQAEVSMDFDDFGTHGSGSGAAFRTTLNAVIELLEGDPVQITNLRFRNLSLDFGTGSNFSSSCTAGQSVPRVYMFFDSRSHPFVINSIKYPPLIRDFRIGTDSNPARAASRIAWLAGCKGFLDFELDRRERGAMSCGGQSALVTRLGFLGDVNVLDVPLIGAILRVCGGSVPNPQPW